MFKYEDEERWSKIEFESIFNPLSKLGSQQQVICCVKVKREICCGGQSRKLVSDGKSSVPEKFVL